MAATAPIPRSPSWDDLYETAAGLEGHFTASQAAEAGYSSQLLAYYPAAFKAAVEQRLKTEAARTMLKISILTISTRSRLRLRYDRRMCRNIKTLYNFEPPATDDEVRAAALQFVRKVTGFNKPSQANAEPFEQAVDEVTAVVHQLFDALATKAPPRDREVEAAKARQRAAQRFGAR